MTRWVVVLGVLVGGAAVVPAGAQLIPPHNISDNSASAVRASRLATRAAKAEMAGNPGEALKMADAAIKADPKDPWGYYDRADALSELNRIDDAVSSFGDAEKHFADEGDAWGRSIAIYGEAHALAEAGRCEQAQPLYERYAAYVETTDARAADMARRYAKDCLGRPARR
jgi:tetratricopeptide (TPR) repeat protein